MPRGRDNKSNHNIKRYKEFINELKKRGFRVSIHKNGAIIGDDLFITSLHFGGGTHELYRILRDNGHFFKSLDSMRKLNYEVNHSYTSIATYNNISDCIKSKNKKKLKKKKK
jgi:hypothetical protein